jgi:hypothetical protein
MDLGEGVGENETAAAHLYLLSIGATEHRQHSTQLGDIASTKNALLAMHNRTNISAQISIQVLDVSLQLRV